MKVQRAENGWNGIFIPGDEALSLSRDLERLANCLDGGTCLVVSSKDIATFMRATAEQLATCWEPKNGQPDAA